MDKNVLKQYIAYMKSSVDAEAIMGLRGAQKFLREFDLNMETVLLYVADNYQSITPVEQVADEPPVSKFMNDAAEPIVPATDSNVRTADDIPDFKSNGACVLEVMFANGAIKNCTVPACASNDIDRISRRMKDAVVAAIINQAHMVLKLFDVVGEGNKVEKTVVRFEFNREDMSPVEVWEGNKGEAGTVASVLRAFIREAMPELFD